MLVSLLPIALALAVGSITWVALRLESAAAMRADHASELVKGFSELNVVTYEYVQHHGRRAAEQWHRRHASLDARLTNLTFNKPYQQQILARVRENFPKLASLFAELSAVEDNPELEHRLAGQLLARSNTMVSLAARLASSSQAEANTIQKRTDMFKLGLVVLTALVVAGVAAMAARSVTVPMTKLLGATHNIGEGNLDQKIGYEGRDELGELSKAFDRMTDKLRKITVSRDELVSEVRERMRAEQMLVEKAEELVRSNADLQQFAYVASHDLKEPLRAVSGFCQLLQQRYHGKIDDKADQYIQEAIDGAARMQTLIDDLLKYARVSTTGGPMESTNCMVVVEKAVANLKASIETTGASVHYSNLPSVTADEPQLLHLFQNLISNAIKYYSGKPPEIDIAAEAKNGEWLFSVRDNGIGIDPKYHDRIFVIFQRLHTRDEYSGTGMGLAICKRIVDRHKGKIWVDSQPGMGSTFSFTIPMSEQEHEYEPPLASADQNVERRQKAEK